MSAENPSAQSGKTVSGEKEVSNPQEEPEAAAAGMQEEDPGEDVVARDAQKLDAVRERLGLPKENAEGPPDWRDTSWTSPEGEKVTLAQLLEYLGDESIDLNVQGLLAQLPPLPRREPDRLEKANLEHPIIVIKREGKLRFVLDGNHRLQKASDAGVENIKARILDLDSPQIPQEFIRIFGTTK